MVEIVDFLINIEYIQFLIMMIQGVKNGLIIEKFLSIIILFFLMCGIALVILVIFLIINIIYSIILKKKINCMDRTENFIVPSIGVALGIVFSITVLTFTIIRNSEKDIQELNRKVNYGDISLEKFEETAECIKYFNKNYDLQEAVFEVWQKKKKNDNIDSFNYKFLKLTKRDFNFLTKTVEILKKIEAELDTHNIYFYSSWQFYIILIIGFLKIGKKRVILLVLLFFIFLYYDFFL
jgi:hypothetical protein